MSSAILNRAQIRMTIEAQCGLNVFRAWQGKEAGNGVKMPLSVEILLVILEITTLDPY